MPIFLDLIFGYIFIHEEIYTFIWEITIEIAYINIVILLYEYLEFSFACHADIEDGCC